MINISVIMSFYRPSTKSRFIFEKSIENILNQTYPYFEFLIYDDGGEDPAGKYVESIQDRRVVFHRFAENSGGLPAVRYNHGLKEAKGKYIFYAFEDDIVDITTLEKLKNKIEITKTDLCYGQTVIHTRANKLIFGAPTGDINKFNYIPNNVILHKKEITDKLGGYDVSLDIKGKSDWLLWKKIIQNNYKSSFVPEILGENFGPMFGTNLRKGK